MISFKGIFGATYTFQEDHQHIKVTKKDGKEFFIPIADCNKVSKVQEALYAKKLADQNIAVLNVQEIND